MAARRSDVRRPDEGVRVGRISEDLFVERQQYLDVLIADAERVRNGEAARLIFTGSSGMGKTRLLDEMTAVIPDMTVFRATASAVDQTVGMRVARRLLAAIPGPDAGLLLDGARSDRPPRLVDECQRRSAAPLRRLTLAVQKLTEQRPVVLCIDDAHHVDSASLMWIDHVACHCRSVLVVLTSPGDGNPTSPSLLDELAADGATRVERLPPLSRAGVAAMVECVLGAADGAFVAECRRLTGGNPGLVRALLDRLVDGGVRPDREHVPVLAAEMAMPIAVKVAAALRECPPRARSLARVAALLGDGAESDQAARIAGIGPWEKDRALPELARVDLIDERNGALGFRYPPAGYAVLAALSDEDRVALHDRAARTLERGAAPAEQIAPHLVHLEPTGETWISERLCEAADAALRAGNLTDAESYLRRALKEPLPGPLKCDALLGLGAAISPVNPAQAAGYLSQAVDHARGSETILLAGLSLSEVLAHGRGPVRGVTISTN